MKKKLITVTAISLFSIVALGVGVSSLNSVNAIESKCEKIGHKYGVERGELCSKAMSLKTDG